MINTCLVCQKVFKSKKLQHTCSRVCSGIRQKKKINYNEVQEYYNSHLQNEVCLKFNISQTTLKRLIQKNKIYIPRSHRDSVVLSMSKRTNVGKAHSIESEIQRRKKISITIRNNPNGGGLREGSGRGKKLWYESPIAGLVYIRSSYELEYVKFLDKNNIKWKPNHKKFPYIFNNKTRNYYPDFYLIDSQEYIEIKGYKTDKDLAKWKMFPYKLTVLMKEDLKKIGCNIK